MRKIKAILADHRYHMHLERTALHEQTRKFCRHDLEHFLAVCRISYIMVLEEPEPAKAWISMGMSGSLDKDNLKELIYATGLLHDIGRWQEYELGEDHALASGKLAIPILQDTGFNNEEITIIVTAIKEHRGIGTAGSYLGKIISDADNLARPCHWCQVKADCYKLEDMLKYYGDTIY